MNTPKLLLIEDNKVTAYSLKEILRDHYIVDIAPTGKIGIYRTDNETYDVIILDLSLPDIPGLAVCQQLRERDVVTPIMVLTGEDRILTKIQLLDAGANDYLTKPFSLGELKARLRALTRRAMTLQQEPGQLVVGDLRLDGSARSVHRGNIEIKLRPKEFVLLECLMTHAGLAVSRDSLLRQAWKGEATVWTNSVDVHIKHLRDKIDRPFGESIIATVHGIGYRLEVPQVARLNQ